MFPIELVEQRRRGRWKFSPPADHLCTGLRAGLGAYACSRSTYTFLIIIIIIINIQYTNAALCAAGIISPHKHDGKQLCCAAKCGAICGNSSSLHTVCHMSPHISSVCCPSKSIRIENQLATILSCLSLPICRLRENIINLVSCCYASKSRTPKASNFRFCPFQEDRWVNPSSNEKGMAHA